MSGNFATPVCIELPRTFVDAGKELIKKVADLFILVNLTYKQACKQADGRTDIQRQTDRQTYSDMQTDRQTYSDMRTDRQTDM